MAPATGFIPHLHAFRGFAILCIIGAHAWSFMIFWTGGLKPGGITTLFHLTETLFHDATLFFTLISGLLFSQILSGKPWHSFFISKVVNVLLPYLVISLILTGIYWPYALEYAQGQGKDIAFLPVLGSNLLLGQASIHLWYIPVLMVLFALTPLLVWLHKRVRWAFWLFSLSPLVISRSPFPDFIQLQTFVFFAGAYALGMGIGLHYLKVQRYVTRYWLSMLLICLAISVTLFLLYQWEYPTGGLFSVYQTLFYGQKALAALLVLALFCRVEARLPQWLMTLGTYSFAIYFLHVTFIGFVIMASADWYSSHREGAWTLVLGSANLLAGILGSILLAKILQKLLGRHSRKLIGV
ncbi:acyltransferase [Aliiglaciecola sp. CAU 1673]|uniref:acyltransferase family protein n=1 Tax=Aliiglaciecola sp. CAU 1673 TaxID=3032595 RepID=UPI0023DAD880|nr:acyltransferase [Aliiglaciecola sp. CAU 1673]MDF2176735.1 acyltransferase [Aliiglaciecola sp. CAU 1673]